MTNKFQTGGQVFFNAVANPFSDAAVADRTYSAAQSSKAATQELVPKELILELYKKGIPVDVDYVTQQLSRLEDRLNKGLPVTKAMTHSVMSKINKVLQNSKYLEDAEKYSEKNDAIGEIAVGNYYGRGQLYVLDRKNDIKSIEQLDNLPDDIDFLKNMLKAEVYTQFPDLGGNIPNDSEDGFQGAITIL